MMLQLLLKAEVAEVLELQVVVLQFQDQVDLEEPVLHQELMDLQLQDQAAVAAVAALIQADLVELAAVDQEVDQVPHLHLVEQQAQPTLAVAAVELAEKPVHQADLVVLE